jgi:hypothetical protein
MPGPEGKAGRSEEGSMRNRVEIFHQKMRGPKWTRYGRRRAGLWYWRLRAHNGKIVADGSEGYASRGNARRAARRVGVLFTRLTAAGF